MGDWLKFAQNVEGFLVRILYKMFIDVIIKYVLIVLRLVRLFRRIEKFFYEKVKTTFVLQAYLVLHCRPAVHYISPAPEQSQVL